MGCVKNIYDILTHDTRNRDATSRHGFARMGNTTEHLTEGRAIDLFVAYRFLRILTTPWEEQPAFKRGIIDKDGKLLKKSKDLVSPDDKKAFTLLIRLVFNLKRILQKVPGLGTKLGTYATALFLLKQHFASQVEEEDMIEDAFKNWLVDNGYATEEEINEHIEHEVLLSGRYKLKEGGTVTVFDKIPVDYVLGQPIFKAIHDGKQTYVSLEDLEEI